MSQRFLAKVIVSYLVSSSADFLTIWVINTWQIYSSATGDASLFLTNPYLLLMLYYFIPLGVLVLFALIWKDWSASLLALILLIASNVLGGVVFLMLHPFILLAGIVALIYAFATGLMRRQANMT